MKGIILTSMFIFTLQAAAHGQLIADTIRLTELYELTHFSAIYTLPHERYQLDHFVLVHQTKRTDPTLQRNEGDVISDEARFFFNRLAPGDTLLVREVYAINSQSPDKGPVKMPDKRFIVK